MTQPKGVSGASGAQARRTRPWQTPRPAIAPEQIRSRYNIVVSLAANEQRDPSRNLELIRAALAGATVQDLFDMERLGAGL